MSDDAFKKQCLDHHNTYRAQHQVKPLTWSDELARDAQAWAQKMARERKLSHCKDRKGCGENIAMMSGRFDEAGQESSKMW